MPPRSRPGPGWVEVEPGGNPERENAQQEIDREDVHRIALSESASVASPGAHARRLVDYIHGHEIQTNRCADSNLYGVEYPHAGDSSLRAENCRALPTGPNHSLWFVCARDAE